MARTRLAALVALSCAVMTVSVVAAAGHGSGGGNGGGGGGGGGVGGGGGSKQIVLSGSVDGLWPGAVAPLPVTIQNTDAHDIMVTTLVVTIGAPTAAGCPSTAISVLPFEGPVQIAGKASATVTLTVMMSKDAPDACQSTEWPLTYTATASRP